MRIVFLLAALATLAACTGADPALPTGPDVVPSARALAVVRDSLATAPTPERRRARIVRAMQRAGITPLADLGRQDALNSRFEVDGVIAGLIPGRHPLARTELVVVGTEVGGPDVAAVLEVARVLVERSQWATVPERTVMVALWDGPRGAERVLNLGVWPRASVRAVIQVGETGAWVQDVPAIRILPSADALDLAEGTLNETIRQARRPAPADTTSAR